MQKAVASISISASLGRRDTSTQLRAGNFNLKFHIKYFFLLFLKYKKELYILMYYIFIINPFL